MSSNPYAADPQAIRGAITPLVTPFSADGSIDLDAIPRLIDWQLEQGSHGISVGGSTGEPTSQTVAERISVMRAAAAAIDGRCPFLPGTGSALMAETLELTAEAERLGASGALVVTPYYGRPQQQGLYDWYARVANEFPDLPLLVYNVPIRAAVDIAPATVARLRRDFANIVGIKETTKDFEHVSYVLDRCGTDFIALSGIELLCYPMLCLGGRGHLSCVGNFAPRPVADLYDAFAAGDHDRARALHYDLHALVDAAFAETNPVPAKWVMERLGLLASGLAREPLAPLSEAGVQRVSGAPGREPARRSAGRRGMSGSSPTRIQIVYSRKPDGVSDEEYDAWYDAHRYEILSIPGFVSVQRFAIEPVVGADSPEAFTHIALYEVEGDFDELARNMALMHLDSADAYVEYKRQTGSEPPLPRWWDDVRFASWNGRSLGDRITGP